MKKNQIEEQVEALVETTITENQPKAEVMEATEQAIDLLTKASLRVYTKGGNDVYAFVKHARKYVRDAAKSRTPKSAEAINTAFASIFAEG